ncbi:MULTISPECIES: GyrI-like domain-containing protein [unclassified Isoptericola]|uniref:GyrI-like domain-containing protein n=1 Tax=unclassified Isoptericola TaxID=2623355 RepID=UPI0027134D54|nr:MULTISPECIES: GyrI-like domain-containing protein [unclassified Isoptericola]MDO8145282.1 GyrI-like domain-containing protein [Isoptericola sp. 178]MDO8148918.1 GyrI-like domain-containing protein [Isoptericola sp. b515]MDO8151139.1 GyrI-like domain-containing protein [Isoptericola sp. b408]
MAETREIHLIESLEQPTFGLRQMVSQEDMPALFARVLPVLTAAMEHGGVQPAGPPYARYRGRMAGGFDVEIGFPLAEPATLTVDDPGPGEPTADVLPEARVVETVHHGGYDGLAATYADLESWMAERHLEPLDQSWEFYEAGPESDPDPTTWRTRIVMPVHGPEVEAG